MASPTEHAHRMLEAFPESIVETLFPRLDARRRMPPQIRLGVVGWNYPEWKGLIYPDGTKPADFLRHYAEKFSVVEAASSYYGMPTKDTVANWAASTPADFSLSLKVPDWMLKKKPDDPDTERVFAVFMDHLAPLIEAKKLGTIVAQFAPQYRREKKAEELAAFVDLFPKGPRWAVELRHDSWWVDDTYDMLRKAGVTLVWSAWDGTNRTPPVMTTDSLYCRIFGDRELVEPFNMKHRDATPELEHWATRLKNEGASAKRADVFVSKYLEGYAPGSVATLAGLLGIPPPDLRAPVAQPKKGPRQVRLGE